MITLGTSTARILVDGLHYPLLVISALVMSLGLYSIVWPADVTLKTTYLTDDACYDYIIIGSGSGAVVANRLTENPATTVLLVEAGMSPSVESIVPATFITIQKSYQDWNYKSEPELASQSQSDGVFKLAAGRTLGGSSQINHLIYLRGDPSDFDGWADLLNDPGWKYENVLPYFLKAETCDDEQILNSEYAKFHNTTGPLVITREPHKKSQPYLDSFVEAGQEKRLDLNGIKTYGYAEPTVSIGNNVRQSTAQSYIKPIAKRQNLFVKYKVIVTKINFDENKNAVSVDILEEGTTYTIKAAKEIIVAAGVYGSPKLLMLSGIGPKDHLTSFGIPVISDLPVGQNLQDHVGVQIVQKMEYSLEIPELPKLNTLGLPAIIGAARINKTCQYPEYQTTNLLIPHDTPFLNIVCAQIFGYKNEICEKLNSESVLRNLLYTLVAVIHPKSRGSVKLRSTDPHADPIISSNFYLDKSDLDDMVDYIVDFFKVHDTEYFKSVNSEPINLQFDGCVGNFESRDYIRCYAEHMSTTLYHQTSTCSMGTVLDSELNVKGVQKLRVVDASVMPVIPRANPLAASVMVAERAADIIKAARKKE